MDRSTSANSVFKSSESKPPLVAGFFLRVHFTTTPSASSCLKTRVPGLAGIRDTQESIKEDRHVEEGAGKGDKYIIHLFGSP